MLDIVFRVDASVKLGSGHIMRCLVLAEQLRSKGANITFVCRQLKGNMIEFVRRKNMDVLVLPSPTNEGSNEDILGVPWQLDVQETKALLSRKNFRYHLMVVDHYGIDIRWEEQIRSLAGKIMIIDDLANRKHDCDILLDQNIIPSLFNRYDSLIPISSIKLLGYSYLLLRTEFIEWRKRVQLKKGNINKILIFFGGSDPTNDTSKAIEAIRLLERKDFTVEVIVGSSNPNRSMVEKYCTEMANFSFHYQTDNMAQLMAESDLAIGTGGLSAWERCFLGLPSIVLTVSDNQYEMIKLLEEKGTLLNLGWSNEVEVNDVYNSLLILINNPYLVSKMSYNALALLEPSELSDIGSIIMGAI